MKSDRGNFIDSFLDVLLARLIDQNLSAKQGFLQQIEENPITESHTVKATFHKIIRRKEDGGIDMEREN